MGAFTELATGSSNDFKNYNIYDMAGNMWEWTTSHRTYGSQMYVVARGGGFSWYGDLASVDRANGIEVFRAAHFVVGFRVVLYIS